CDQKDSAGAGLDRAAGGDTDPGLRAEVLLALVAEAEMNVLIRTFAATAVLAALAFPAFGGGDDYDAMNDEEGKGPVYYGFVRDNRGSPVADAQVVLKPKSGEALVLKSNVLGLYRSHLSKEFRP